MFHDMEHIARLLKVGYIKFFDIEEGEFFRKWMNELIEKYGDDWIVEHRNELIKKFKTTQQERERLFKLNKKKEKKNVR